MIADFRRIALSAAIAIVATILVVMASRAIFPSPERPTCERNIYSAPVPVVDGSEETPEAKADREACRVEIDRFEQSDKQAAKNQFFVLLAGSVAMILIGGFLYTVPVVSSGILWGGVVSLIFALFFGFRPGIEDYLRLVAAVVSFLVLVALAYRLFGKERERGSK